MAGRGPPPKSAKTRQRRNKKPGSSSLPNDTSVKAPKLESPDKRTFHKLTRDWWKRVWTSPMAGEYLPTDADGLARLAMLVDDFNKSHDPRSRKELMVEIRLQEARFGLSPVDRSRLQWEVQKGEEAERRRKPQAVAKPPVRSDPRKTLKIVR